MDVQDAVQDAVQSFSEPPDTRQLSILQGPIDPPLVDLTLGELLDVQCQQYGAKECLVIPWTGARWTYNELHVQSSYLSSALRSMGIGSGDRVGIMAGNCEQYIAVLFAVARTGAILVILNNTYTATEAQYALDFTGCKLLFTTSSIGRLDNVPLLQQLNKRGMSSKVIILRGPNSGHQTYDDLIQRGSKRGSQRSSPQTSQPADATTRKVLPYDICNMQFTSGTTGHPKAACLTHHNIVNNARFIGDRMALGPEDVLCCPPPLFHCFGLVLGLLAAVTHGAKIVYPGEVFDPNATLSSITEEHCTAVHGVPTMFDSLFNQPIPPEFNSDKLRTGIIAGAPVPRYLMEALVDRFGMSEFTSSYGLTEASPTCFNAFVDDSIDKRLTTVGTLMPHAHAKIVDHSGRTVPIGVRGELCMAGYQLQCGYWNNTEKTNEAMVRDERGVLWLHTGDEAVFDEEGYCTITGRFKDIIIRGGENIYPLEIEERLMEHPTLSRAIVVGIKDARYGEVVGAFLERDATYSRLSDEEVRSWIGSRLGRQKADVVVFWLGEDGVPLAVPVTGSGKVRKFELAKLGEDLMRSRQGPKL